VRTAECGVNLPRSMRLSYSPSALVRRCASLVRRTSSWPRSCRGTGPIAVLRCFRWKGYWAIAHRVKRFGLPAPRGPTCLWCAHRVWGDPAVLSAPGRRSTRANLDSTTERWGLKSENRTPKPKTNPKHQQGNDQNYAAATGFEHWAIGNLNLFRVSNFGFRISQPWIVVLAEHALSYREQLILLASFISTPATARLRAT